MSVLLTKFPAQKTALLNQTSYNDKLQFWKSRLHSSLAHNKSIFFNLNSLTSDPKFNMIYKGKAKPDIQIFQTVLSSELNTEFIDLTTHERNTQAVLANSSQTWSFWFQSKVSTAVFGTSNTDYVSLHELRRLTDLLKSHLDPGTIFDRSRLNTEIAIAYGRILDEREMNAFLAHLKSQDNLILTNTDNTIFELFPQSNDSKGFLSQGAEAKYQLKNSIQSLEERIQSEESKIQEMWTEIKTVMHKGQKTKALNLLKRVKGREKKLDNFYNQQSNLQTLLDTIMESETETEILTSLQTGIQSLRSINSETNVEKVDDVMADLSDVIADANDVSNAISSQIEQNSSQNQDELDNELDSIFQEMEKQRIQKELEEKEAKSKEDSTLDRLKALEGDYAREDDDIFDTIDEISGRMTRMEVNPNVRFEQEKGAGEGQTAELA